MHINQARQFLGKNVSITYRDRSGNLRTQTTHVYDISYVPSYGACLIGETDDIWLDRVTQITSIAA